MAIGDVYRGLAFARTAGCTATSRGGTAGSVGGLGGSGHYDSLRDEVR